MTGVVPPLAVSELMLGVVTGALGAVAAVLLQRIIEKPVEKVAAIRRQALADARAARERCTTALESPSRHLRELDHCISHLEGDPTPGHYVASAREHASAARREARAVEPIVGEDFVVAVHAETDLALAFVAEVETAHKIAVSNPAAKSPGSELSQATVARYEATSRSIESAPERLEPTQRQPRTRARILRRNRANGAE